MIARVAAAIAIALVTATGIALDRYELARETWRAEAAGIGTPGYDADASDAAYREVAAMLVWVERAAKTAAVAVVVAGIAIGRARPRTTRTESSRARRVAARVIDAITLGVVLAATQLSAGSPGITAALQWLAPVLLLSPLAAAAANGATLGDRIARS